MPSALRPTSLLACSLLAVAAPSLRAQAAAPEQPIDFAKVDRSLPKLPKLQAEDPLYALFLFGKHAEKRVWMVLDRSDAKAKEYDVLYFDRDGNGDLTQADERVVSDTPAGKDHRGPTRRFKLDTLIDPATGAEHTDASVTWTTWRVSFRMKWRGTKITMGAYGPDSDTYGKASTDPDTAPILVPGWDRPFEFERWYGGEMARGAATDFKVFVGNRGSVTGAFTCVDDKFLPGGDHPVATLLYETTGGERKAIEAALLERC